MRANLAITPVINYFNLTNSRWEGLLDPWELSISVSDAISDGCALILFPQATKNAITNATSVSLASKKRLEINITHTFIELAMNAMTMWSQQSEELLKTSRGSTAPFLIRNRTGYDIAVWAEVGDMTKRAPEVQYVKDGEEIPWRLDDWKTMRESATTAVVHNSVGLALRDTPWERLKHISVEREGELVYRLKPKLEKVSHRLLCEIKLVNNVKVITFRSTFKVENLTLVSTEMIIVDGTGKKVSPTYKLREQFSFPTRISSERSLQHLAENFRCRFRLRTLTACDSDQMVGRGRSNKTIN